MSFIPSSKFGRRFLPALFLVLCLYLMYCTITSQSSSFGVTLRGNDLYVLPKDLEDVILKRFDSFVHQKRIYYDPGDVVFFNDDGFEFEFHAVEMLKVKPITSPDDPGRKKAGGPFTRLQSDEIVATIGPAHRLILNKYCHYRPMLVLPTIEFARQSDDLDMGDFTAAWSVLKTMKTPQMVIYNCGVNSGSSQGHKHLQLFPVPEHLRLFPSMATSASAITSDISSVPFKHFVLRLPNQPTVQDVYRQYSRLLIETKKALLEANTSPDYNMVLTSEWIALIPRRTAYAGGPYGANAAGMVGMVAVRDQQEIAQWQELGFTSYLTTLGIPR